MTSTAHVPIAAVCPYCNSADTVPLFDPLDAYQCAEPGCGREFSWTAPPPHGPFLSEILDPATGATVALVTSEPLLFGELRPNGYILPVDLSFERWVEITRYLQEQATSINWRLGDALVFGLDKWGDHAYQAVADQALVALGRSDEWIDQIAQVARAFPPSTRLPELRWSHHRAVMLRELPAVERAALLEEAAQEGLSTRELGRRAQGRANVLQGNVLDKPPEALSVDSDAFSDDTAQPHAHEDARAEAAILSAADAYRLVADIDAARALVADFTGFVASLLTKKRQDGLHLKACRIGEAVDGYWAPDYAPCSTQCDHARALVKRAAALNV